MAQVLPAAGQRNTALDMVKTIAIFGVIVIHVSSSGFYGEITSPGWLTALFWGTISRASVPLFLMCSGAIFLRPDWELSLKKLYGKYMLRIVIALICWAVAYKAFALVQAGTLTAAAIWAAIGELLVGKDELHLYYLRVILLVYAFLPLTRLLVRHATRRELEYLLVLWLLSGVLLPNYQKTMAFLPVQFPGQWAMSSSYAGIGYGVLGYYCSTFRPLSGRGAVATALLGVAITAGGTLVYSLRQGSLYTAFFDGASIGVCLLAVGIYSMCAWARPAKRSAALCAHIAKASFCIYLVHVLFMKLFAHWDFTIATLPRWASIPLLTIALFAASYATWQVLRRIPAVKKYLI